MAYLYNFAIDSHFEIQLKHKFSKEELEDIKGTFELLGEELKDELSSEMDNVSLLEYPEKLALIIVSATCYVIG